LFARLERTTCNLWNSTLPDCRSLQIARSFLLRYSGKAAEWPFRDFERDAGKLDRMIQTSERARPLFDRDSKPDGANELEFALRERGTNSPPATFSGMQTPGAAAPP